MPIKLLTDAHDAMERATSSEELLVEVGKFAKSMGFDHFGYVLMINTPTYKPQQYILNGYPVEWSQRYISQGYFKVDPLIRHIESTTLPAIWHHDMFNDGKAEQFWEEARSYSVNAGLTFSVHDQPGVTGVFALARDRIVDVEGQDLAALIGRAQLFASMLHHAVCRIDLAKLLPETNVSLTGRERESLKWAAEGKTAWEIGQILGIAERTAVFHLNNAIRKMGAANKAQAIVRAVALRLV
jgi:DNA-binding CsgD family transcriptional regulator